MLTQKLDRARSQRAAGQEEGEKLGGCRYKAGVRNHKERFQGHKPNKV